MKESEPTTTRDKAEAADVVRVAANLLFAAAQPAASRLTRLTGRGVPEDERARRVDGPVTPANGAFVIWAPIFLANLAYAVFSATGERRSDPVLRRIGWLTSTAFAGNVSWIVNTQLRGIGWSSLAIIAASAASATAALLEAERSRDESENARFAAMALAPLAGWLTVASFANVEAALNQENGRPTRREESRRATTLVAAATGAAAGTALATRGNPLFAAAAAWGLGGIVLRNLRNRFTRNRPVAAAAGLGLVALAGATLWARARA